jgi:pyruvate,orthophosphate dikinase
VSKLYHALIINASCINHFSQIGVHGEHGGDPMSIHFFDRIGIDYVSCSPYRIPVAKVAAAQAHIEETASE